MTKRTWRQFLTLFTTTFTIFLFLSVFIIMGFTDGSIWNHSLEKKVTYLPLLLYLLLFAFITSSILLTSYKIIENRKSKRIEDALKMLNSGEYSAQIFLNMFSEETPIQVNEMIDREFLLLHEKMLLISEEAVSSAQQATVISEETREEILEKERHRIARELHDSVSQQLFAAAMLLSTVQEVSDDLPDPIKAQMNVINKIVGEAQSEMRALLLHLRPVKLDGKSLKKGIEQLLDELKTKVAIKIKHDIEDVKMTEVMEDHLFRIVQELISNLLRHSKATEVEVYLKKTEDFYQLRFVDDGLGFDMDEKKSSGFGLRNIKERISALGGNVRIISFPNQGTSVEIRVPLITGG